MKKIAAIICLLSVLVCVNVLGQSKEKMKRLIKESAEAKQEFLDKDFQMEDHFAGAYAYVIFPNVGKGAIGVGGAAGTGIVYERGVIIGVAKLSQVSIGFQFGGQAYREIIFIESKKDLENFKNNKVKLSAQASAVACTEGASANARYRDGIMIFTMQKGGLMYEASVGGQVFKFKPLKKDKKKRRV